MNDQRHNAMAAQTDARKEFDVIELLIMLLRHKKLLLVMPVVMGLLAALLSLTMPNLYRANTKLLPPQQGQSSAAALLSQLGSVASIASGSTVKNPNDVYIAMLKSRNLADRLIKRFALDKVYNAQSPEAARKALDGVTNIQTGKDGLITIEVSGTDQKLVAPLANGYVEELLNLTHVLAVTEASQRRKFFEQQLELAKDSLAAAEASLKQGMDTRGVISVDSESRAIVETVGRLRAQVSAKEIEINSMGAFLTANNPEYRRAQENLNSLRAQLAKLENGAPGDRVNGAQARPLEGLENIKLLREVKYYQMLYELLSKQYEAARLDEAKDVALIQVLDKAVEPEHRFKPKRSLVALAGAIIGLFLACLWAIVFEIYKAAVRTPARAAQLSQLVAAVRQR